MKCVKTRTVIICGFPLVQLSSDNHQHWR